VLTLPERLDLYRRKRNTAIDSGNKAEADRQAANYHSTWLQWCRESRAAMGSGSCDREQQRLNAAQLENELQYAWINPDSAAADIAELEDRCLRAKQHRGCNRGGTIADRDRRLAAIESKMPDSWRLQQLRRWESTR
jgi:hypothetical protein